MKTVKKAKLVKESRVSAGDLDATSAFMKSIRRGGYDRKLSREEELELATRWKEEGDQDAKNKLMAHNQLLVYTIARSVCKQNMEMLQDFVDEGMIGLSTAIDHFDPSKGNRLSTVAYPWIKKVLIEYLYGDADSMVRRPHNYQIGSNINKINARFFAEHGRYPEVDELKDLLMQTRGLNIPEDELRDVVMNSMNTPVSKSDDDDDAEYGTVGEFAARTSSLNSYERDIENDYIASKVEKLLRSVDARTRDILQRKYGMGPYDYEQPDDQIAEELGLTKTRVQQLINAAYKKLREQA